jgi:hypothetical protein
VRGAGHRVEGPGTRTSPATVLKGRYDRSIQKTGEKLWLKISNELELSRDCSLSNTFLTRLTFSELPLRRVPTTKERKRVLRGAVFTNFKVEIPPLGILRRSFRENLSSFDNGTSRYQNLSKTAI